MLIVAAFAGMLALCIVLWGYGGAGGLAGAAVGFLLRVGGNRLDWGERLGNAYVGALMGMPVGLMLGGAYALGVPYLLSVINHSP